MTILPFLKAHKWHGAVLILSFLLLILAIFHSFLDGTSWSNMVFLVMGLIILVAAMNAINVALIIAYLFLGKRSDITITCNVIFASMVLSTVALFIDRGLIFLT